jgi:putative transposase
MKSKNLRNAVLFRLRQWFTLQGSDSLQPLQEEVFNEVMLTCRKSGKPVPGKVISYAFMDRLLRVNKNPDYFSGLPMQSAQAIAGETVNEFENWLKALAAYNKDPSLFTGKPKMPKYTKAEQRMITMTNHVDHQIKCE